MIDYVKRLTYCAIAFLWSFLALVCVGAGNVLGFAIESLAVLVIAGRGVYLARQGRI